MGKFIKRHASLRTFSGLMVSIAAICALCGWWWCAAAAFYFAALMTIAACTGFNNYDRPSSI
jgi:hypothetical protein